MRRKLSCAKMRSSFFFAGRRSGRLEASPFRCRTGIRQLEQELDRVDTLVKSGNLMADAILNSKLTLARRYGISVNCKAKLPEQIPVEEGKRFLRIYMSLNKSQFYLSIQNSAKEEPDFDERNYISKKRGNHGLGMKRVKTAVDKYQGFLNLANEPGIFAAEATLPLLTYS